MIRDVNFSTALFHINHLCSSANLSGSHLGFLKQLKSRLQHFEKTMADEHKATVEQHAQANGTTHIEFSTALVKQFESCQTTLELFLQQVDDHFKSENNIEIIGAINKFKIEIAAIIKITKSSLSNKEALISRYLHNDRTIYQAADLLGGLYIVSSQSVEPFAGAVINGQTVEENGGNCAGHFVKWSFEYRDQGAPSYSVLGTSNVHKLQQDHAAFLAQYFIQGPMIPFGSLNLPELFKDVEVDRVYELFMTGENGAHATGVKFHANQVVHYMDPNFGDFFFPNKHSFIQWYSIYLTHMRLRDFPTDHIALCRSKFTIDTPYVNPFPSKKHFELACKKHTTQESQEQYKKLVSNMLMQAINRAESLKKPPVSVSTASNSPAMAAPDSEDCVRMILSSEVEDATLLDYRSFARLFLDAIHDQTVDAVQDPMVKKIASRLKALDCMKLGTSDSYLNKLLRKIRLRVPTQSLELKIQKQELQKFVDLVVQFVKMVKVKINLLKEIPADCPKLKVSIHNARINRLTQLLDKLTEFSLQSQVDTLLKQNPAIDLFLVQSNQLKKDICVLLPDFDRGIKVSDETGAITYCRLNQANLDAYFDDLWGQLMKFELIEALSNLEVIHQALMSLNNSTMRINLVSTTYGQFVETLAVTAQKQVLLDCTHQCGELITQITLGKINNLNELDQAYSQTLLNRTFVTAVMLKAEENDKCEALTKHARSLLVAIAPSTAAIAVRLHTLLHGNSSILDTLETEANRLSVKSSNGIALVRNFINAQRKIFTEILNQHPNNPLNKNRDFYLEQVLSDVHSYFGPMLQTNSNGQIAENVIATYLNELDKLVHFLEQACQLYKLKLEQARTHRTQNNLKCQNNRIVLRWLQDFDAHLILLLKLEFEKVSTVLMQLQNGQMTLPECRRILNTEFGSPDHLKIDLPTHLEEKLKKAGLTEMNKVAFLNQHKLDLIQALKRETLPLESSLRITRLFHNLVDVSRLVASIDEQNYMFSRWKLDHFSNARQRLATESNDLLTELGAIYTSLLLSLANDELAEEHALQLRTITDTQVLELVQIKAKTVVNQLLNVMNDVYRTLDGFKQSDFNQEQFFVIRTKLAVAERIITALYATLASVQNPDFNYTMKKIDDVALCLNQAFGADVINGQKRIQDDAEQTIRSQFFKIFDARQHQGAVSSGVGLVARKK